MNTLQNLQFINESLTELKNEYKAIKGLILTESDLKCLIYTKLMRFPQFSNPQRTEEGIIYSNPLHTELSWFDERGKLTIKPDITILEPNRLRITKGKGHVVRLPSKQFSFNGNAIIFELKFIRNSTGITERIFMKQILKDFEKVEGLFQRLESQGMYDQVFCYFVIFNKTNKTCSSFDRFIQEKHDSNRYQIIYASGDVDNKNISNNASDYPRRDIMDTYGIRRGSFNMIQKSRHVK